MKELIKIYLHEKGKHFFRGAFGGGSSGFIILFNAGIDWRNLTWLFLIKFAGLMIIAVSSGIMYVLGVDLYNKKIRHKIFKSDQNEQSKDDDKAA